jgi:hypothetical protein
VILEIEIMEYTIFLDFTKYYRYKCNYEDNPYGYSQDFVAFYTFTIQHYKNKSNHSKNGKYDPCHHNPYFREIPTK